jgi:hypothetical protein
MRGFYTMFFLITHIAPFFSTSVEKVLIGGKKARFFVILTTYTNQPISTKARK